MANRHIRIYEGVEKNTSIIGASMSASSAVYDPRVHEFLHGQGYETNALPSPSIVSDPEAGSFAIVAPERPEKSMSWYHLEVRPPLTPGAIETFGRFLQSEHIVDSDHSEALLHDNRGNTDALIAVW